MAQQFPLHEHPHRRFNPLTGEWVLVSPHRTKRPWQGKVESTARDQRPAYDPGCYLCPGNQRAGGQQTPAYTSTHVFTNDFSALLPDTPDTLVEDGLLRARGESGVCRVICFSPNHALTLPEMTEDNLLDVVTVWQLEYAELGALPHINHVQIFENKGDVMGCSNPHPHGQIWAQHSIPNEVAKKTARQAAYFEQNGSSLLADYLAQERKEGTRILLENAHFVALVPFWAVWPYEAMIIPVRQQQHIGQINEAEKTSFVSILKGLTIRFDNLFQTSFPYSAGIHQAPTDGAQYPGWHWHMSFYPPLLRSATVKKFMVGYEMFGESQRDITPEQAAETLRKLSGVHYREQAGT
ncbi:MAG: UDP-glucose--hexose-1-phosphate uridylyltransferase [Bacteroidetes bacterium]|nr:MAG: UDP-glucose--hexose-1-phosphate uridylyltransferase [Bacteroidota bacterium]